jgi:hypothetical protein
VSECPHGDALVARGDFELSQTSKGARADEIFAIDPVCAMRVMLPSQHHVAYARMSASSVSVISNALRLRRMSA